MRQEENGPAGGEEQEEADVDGEREEAGGPAGGEERVSMERNSLH